MRKQQKKLQGGGENQSATALKMTLK